MTSKPHNNNTYPFGSVLGGRNGNVGDYRYGQGSKESDNEIKGIGNSIDYNARMYDTRLGHWLSIDPKFRDYAGFSPYCAYNNNPILFVDPSGKGGVAYLEEAATAEKPGIIRVEATFYLYGAEATDKLAGEMQSQVNKDWNIQDNIVTVDGLKYQVNFSIAVMAVSEQKAQNGAYGENEFANEPNTDPGTNYFRVEKSNPAVIEMYGFDASSSIQGGNAGFLITSDNLGSTNTLAHELGHLFGFFDNLSWKQTEKYPIKDIMVPTCKGEGAGSCVETTKKSERQVTNHNLQTIFNNYKIEKNKGFVYLGNASNQIYNENGEVVPKKE